jgi:transposase
LKIGEDVSEQLDVEPARFFVHRQPLSERLAELLRQRPCLHADETLVRQLEP